MTEFEVFSTQVIQDHDPFGMIILGRNWGLGSDYSYGFNGKENIDEIYGYSNAIDFGARVYDTRLGRWFAIDILTSKYPYESPYLFCSLNPILYIDDDGNEKTIIHVFVDKATGEKIVLEVVTTNDLQMVEISVPPSGPGSEHSQNVIHYAYYDFSVTYVHTMENGKIIGDEKGEKVLGEKRGETLFPAETLMELSIGKPEWGGVNWTSYDGQGQETKKGTIDVKQENIDLLLSTISASKSAGGDPATTLFDYFILGLEAQNLTYEIIELTPPGESDSEPKQFKCEYCNDTIPATDTTDGNGHPGPFIEVEQSDEQ